MNDRLIFPKLKLFKKEVTERFLVATREIYKQHPVYLFAEEEDNSQILIYPSYANVSMPGKQPKLVIKSGAYNYGLNDTFFNNMSNEVKNAEGLISGYEHDQIINTQVVILVQAYAEEESSDLADELTSLAVYACRNMYAQVGISIRGAQVSETDAISKEEDLFQTVVTFVLDVPWGSSTTNNGPAIDDNLPELDEETIVIDTYKSPGINVIPEIEKDY